MMWLLLNTQKKFQRSVGNVVSQKKKTEVEIRIKNTKVGTALCCSGITKGLQC